LLITDEQAQGIVCATFLNISPGCFSLSGINSPPFVKPLLIEMRDHFLAVAKREQRVEDDEALIF